MSMAVITSTSCGTSASYLASSITRLSLRSSPPFQACHQVYKHALELAQILLRLPMPFAIRDFEWRFSVGPSEVHRAREPFDPRYDYPFTRPHGIANFGFNKMPFLLVTIFEES